MKFRSKLNHCAAAVLLPTLAWAWMPMSFAADDKPATASKAKKQPADYRGPLPYYYAKVVSPDQKEKLYIITEKYSAEIKSLQAKIEELEAARNKELDKALTPEQLKRVAELRMEAAKRREADKTADAKSE